MRNVGNSSFLLNSLMKLEDFPGGTQEALVYLASFQTFLQNGL